MNPGKEYEGFVFETFQKFFPDFAVVKNDHIRGSQSGLMREIDVSMRGRIVDTDIIYIIQAKDYTRPADVNVIGAFSAVIQDVGASKGFLICAAGFAKTIRDYARSLGIELLTIKDINAEKWVASVQIPVVLTVYDTAFKVAYSCMGTSELEAEIAKRQAAEIPLDAMHMSFDSGATFGTQHEQLKAAIHSLNPDLSKEHEIVFPDGQVKASIFGCQIEVTDAKLFLKPLPRHYLKYVTPEEYRHVVDHLNDIAIPVHAKFAVDGLAAVVDESWIRVPQIEIPVKPAGLWLHFEMRPDKVGDVHMASVSADFE